MNRTIASVAVADGLVIAPDLSGFIHCVDARTGKKYWTYDASDSLQGAPLIVDGKVYVADEEGDVVVLRLSKDPAIAMPDGVPWTIFSHSKAMALIWSSVWGRS